MAAPIGVDVAIDSTAASGVTGGITSVFGDFVVGGGSTRAGQSGVLGSVLPLVVVAIAAAALVTLSRSKG